MTAHEFGHRGQRDGQGDVVEGLPVDARGPRLEVDPGVVGEALGESAAGGVGELHADPDQQVGLVDGRARRVVTQRAGVDTGEEGIAFVEHGLAHRDDGMRQARRHQGGELLADTEAVDEEVGQDGRRTGGRHPATRGLGETLEIRGVHHRFRSHQRSAWWRNPHGADVGRHP